METWRQRHPVLRWIGFLIKNVLGVILVLMGLAMLVLPGQGVLTLLIGISLLDFPWQAKPGKENRPDPNRPSSHGRNPPPGWPAAPSTTGLRREIWVLSRY